MSELDATKRIKRLCGELLYASASERGQLLDRLRQDIRPGGTF